MSRSSTTGTVRLEVYGAHPATEIRVTDDRFRQILQGMGRVEDDLKPGLYEVEFKVGDAVHSEYAVLRPGSGPVTIQGPELAFSTPAPIAKTQTMHEYHSEPARRLSAPAYAPRGAERSSLYIFVRDLERVGRRKNPARGVSLHSLADDQEISAYSEWEYDIEQQWAGIRLAVEPGAYRLRVHTGVAGTLEQIVVACPDWQTQVFMGQRAFQRPGKRTARRADLFNASIFMTQMSGWTPDAYAFEPNREDSRLIELARMSLAERRWAVPYQDLQEMLWAKFDNPMLGIYGGHLLLLSEEPDVPLLDTVVGNLRALLGDHPDVEALGIRTAELRGETLTQLPDFAAPPMLRSSWHIVVSASARYPGLVPAGSLAAQISDSIWADGAWLVWQHLRPRKKAVPVDLSALNDLLPWFTDKLSDPEWLRKTERRRDLDNAERSLLQYLKSVVDQAQYQPRAPRAAPAPPDREVAEELPAATAPEPYLTEEALVGALNAPSAAVSQTAACLMEKLELED